MKKNRFTSLLLVMFFVGTTSLIAGTKTEKFKVSGNCDMCKNRIEKAALSIEGVSKADWNKETNMILVTFDDSKTDVHKIHMAIAKVGHDTEMHKANDEAYSELHGCCKYDRSEIKSSKNCHQGNKHSDCQHSKKSTNKSSCCNKN